jgi:hypothetical protein
MHVSTPNLICHRCANVCNVARMHQLLRWANKREVARELSRRGFDVSGETLNRWVRDEREFPAVVERMVLDMYGIAGTTKEAAPPEWAERLVVAVDSVLENQATIISEQKRTAESVAPLDRLLNVEGLRDWLEGLPQPSDVDPLDLPDTGVRGTGAPGGRASS